MEKNRLEVKEMVVLDEFNSTALGVLS